MRSWCPGNVVCRQVMTRPGTARWLGQLRMGKECRRSFATPGNIGSATSATHLYAPDSAMITAFPNVFPVTVKLYKTHYDCTFLLSLAYQTVLLGLSINIFLFVICTSSMCTIMKTRFLKSTLRYCFIFFKKKNVIVIR